MTVVRAGETIARSTTRRKFLQRASTGTLDAGARRRNAIPAAAGRTRTAGTGSAAIVRAGQRTARVRASTTPARDARRLALTASPAVRDAVWGVRGEQVMLSLVVVTAIGMAMCMV